ncbi:uncharacterized protein TNCV_5052581 [Trichonephila clavipes]|nr:uncharacterized protein TNCV_5052581 [Trichonephila clavipes]
MCHENESWTRSLPIILLGLRTIWRADYEATSAELLYGESICLPYDFFEDTQFQPQSEFVQTHKATIKDFKPVPFSYHSKQKPFIFKDPKFVLMCSSALTVFVRACNHHIMDPIRLKPCFSDNSSESDIESSIGEDTHNKPAEMREKKIRFAPLPLLPPE